jgi:hypothetical protein
MAQSLQFLRSTTPGQKPTQLDPGQIAFNLADKLLFIGDGSNSIVDQNGNVTAGVAGFGFFTSDLDIVTSTTSSAAYTDSKLAELIDGAPGLLDTLNELAAAIGDDANFATTITNSIAATNSDLANEITRAQAAESALSSSLAAETSRAQAAEGANATAIASETSRAQAAEAQLASDLAAESTRALAAEAANAAAITAEETRALAAEAALQSSIDNEVTRATLSEQVLSERVYSIEENLNTKIEVIYDDINAVFPDEKPPVEDTSYREGWYFTNAGGGKINWYFFDGTSNPSSVGDLSAYAVVTLDSLVSKPFLSIHTTPLGDGGDASSWYRSRHSFVWPAGTYITGKKYLMVVEGSSALDPKVHPELDRVYLTKEEFSSRGPQLDSENAMLVSLQSDSSSSAGNVQFLADSVGVRTNAGYDVESKLRFRKVSVTAWASAFEQGSF